MTQWYYDGAESSHTIVHFIIISLDLKLIHIIHIQIKILTNVHFVITVIKRNYRCIVEIR